jgi:hypothetical protein
MATIIEPESFAIEERLRIPIAGGERCWVVSGYADFSSQDEPDDGHPLYSKLNGAGLDKRWWGHTVHMVVGPKWHEVTDVSPVVNIAGISFQDSDETDHTGYEVLSCKWDTVSLPEPEQNLRRIRLKVELRMCGGEQSSISMLSYHFVAIGRQLASVG